MTENWKPVVGWESFYEVSDFGRVRSLARKVKRGNGLMTVPERMLKQTDKGHGYLTVRFSRDGKGKNFYVHRLVGLTFIDPNWKEDFDHIDRNPLNNSLCNLRKATRSQNLSNNGASGVCFSKKRGRWIASITVQYKHKYLGSFHSREKAMEVRKKAELKYFGEFANV